MALTKEEKALIVKDFAKSEKDTGSAEVQIAILTKEIAALTVKEDIARMKYVPEDEFEARVKEIQEKVVTQCAEV